MNQISNRQVVCETLIELAKQDPHIVVLVSDSRGSASMSAFGEAYPHQFLDIGIAEQNLVGISAGLGACGKKPFIASPAAFLTMRSIEQVKLDVAYSQTNVKLIGISGGVSYGPLGMSHHSLQDLAVTRSIPGLNVLMPADRHETRNMVVALVGQDAPSYMRIGRNPVADCYTSTDYEFAIGKATLMSEGGDITLIACGETVRIALDSAAALQRKGIRCRVLNMHTIKPLDKDAVLRAATETGRIITIEEHSVYGGLGAAVAEVIIQHHPVPLRILGIADEPAVTGRAKEIFAHYGLTTENVVNVALQMLKDVS